MNTTTRIYTNLKRLLLLFINSNFKDQYLWIVILRIKCNINDITIYIKLYIKNSFFIIIINISIFEKKKNIVLLYRLYRFFFFFHEFISISESYKLPTSRYPGTPATRHPDKCRDSRDGLEFVYINERFQIFQLE